MMLLPEIFKMIQNIDSITWAFHSTSSLWCFYCIADWPPIGLCFSWHPTPIEVDESVDSRRCYSNFCSCAPNMSLLFDWETNKRNTIYTWHGLDPFSYLPQMHRGIDPRPMVPDVLDRFGRHRIAFANFSTCLFEPPPWVLLGWLW